MKRILLFLFLFSTAFAQTKVFQLKDYILLYNASLEQRTTCIAGLCYNEIIGTDTLARIYNDGTIYWKANLVAASIKDTLSASGITGICRITIPETVTTQRVIQFYEVAVIFSSTSYTVNYADNMRQLPITVRRNSDGQEMCIIYPGGIIDWIVTPQYAWLGRVGTTRVKRITLP